MSKLPRSREIHVSSDMVRVPYDSLKLIFLETATIGGDTLLPVVRNPTLDSYVYSGDALRAFACPLGPNGGGCIALAGDGGLRQWQISNRVFHTAYVPDSFFAVRVVDSARRSSACVLQSAAQYDQTGFVPAPYVSDHVVPPSSIALLKELPGVATLQITGKYPIMEVDYLSAETPIKLSMETFNPCIPMNR
jgi:non-lysosomal glucosylceramidase